MIKQNLDELIKQNEPLTSDKQIIHVSTKYPIKKMELIFRNKTNKSITIRIFIEALDPLSTIPHDLDTHIYKPSLLEQYIETEPTKLYEVGEIHQKLKRSINKTVKSLYETSFNEIICTRVEHVYDNGMISAMFTGYVKISQNSMRST